MSTGKKNKTKQKTKPNTRPVVPEIAIGILKNIFAYQNCMQR